MEHGTQPNFTFLPSKICYFIQYCYSFFAHKCAIQCIFFQNIRIIFICSFVDLLAPWGHCSCPLWVKHVITTKLLEKWGLCYVESLNSFTKWAENVDFSYLGQSQFCCTLKKCNFAFYGENVGKGCQSDLVLRQFRTVKESPTTK